MLKHLLFLSAILTCTFIPGLSQPAINFQNIASGFSNPVDVVEENTPSKRLFIVEQPGRIKIFNGTTVNPQVFLDISSIISSGGEQGLLSLAFHPDYATNGFFYVWYTAPDGSVTLARYTRSSGNADQADPGSGVVMLQIPKRFANHNGAKLNFGSDGYLYFATGDGGSGGDPDNNGQNPATLLGKMLRIDVNNPNPPYYGIPPTNPFAGSATARQEIIALGLRNPWRWSFDRSTGDMWIADVGQNAWEEVNFVPAAQILNKNYGWNCLEGSHVYTPGCTTPANNVLPVFEYGRDNTTGGRSITGGYVYRGNLYPSLNGYYVFADFISGNGWLTRNDGAGGFTTTIQKGWPGNLTSFGEGSDGKLYALSLGGVLYSLSVNEPLAAKLLSFSATRSGSNHTVSWTVANEENGDAYTIEKSTTGNPPFSIVQKVLATSANPTKTHTVSLVASGADTWYRLLVTNTNGANVYSPVIKISGEAGATFKAVVISNNMVISLPPKAKTITLLDASGKVLYNKPVTNSVAERISLDQFARGIVIIRIVTDKDVQVSRVLY